MSKAEQTKAFIIEKTAPIFNKKGYAGTSLSDLTDATGLTKGSIYGNFEDKEAVAMAAFDFNLKKVNEVIRGEMEKEKTAKGKLMVYVRLYSQFQKYPFPEGGCPVMNTAIESDDTHAGLRHKASTAIISWKDSLVALIKGGIKSKEFSSSTDAESIAVTVLSMIEGATMIAGVTRNPHYRTTVMQSVKRVIEGME